MDTVKEKRRKVISAKRMIIPAVIAILLMHALIVFNTVRINDMGSVIAEVTQRNFQLGGMSAGYSQGTDALGGMAMSFVNTGSEESLAGYFAQLDQIEGSYNGMLRVLSEQHDTENVARPMSLPRAQAAESESPEACLQDSYEVVNQRVKIEETAIAMAARARGMDLDAYPRLKEIELPDVPAGLPAEAQIAEAREMLSDSDYQSMRGGVQRNMSMALSNANNITASVIQHYSERLATYRMEQWILIALIITTMLVMIVLLFVWLLIPLEKSVELVQQGQMLSQKQGFSELQRLANSYDQLLKHRNELESDLRERSYTDALTGLPNRMAYQEYIKKLEKLPEDTSIAVCSMDVNGLKSTNDKSGHLKGDILLRESAACILKSFGDETGKNVFRIGGDEFAAICLNCSEEQIKEALERFREEQERYGISISAGYAWAPSVRDEKIQQLFEKADRLMYGNKAQQKKKRK